MFTMRDQDPRQEFELLETIGKGSFGAVFKAKRRKNGEVVAVKKMNVVGEDVDKIIAEINIMKEIDSPYVVRYHGNYFWKNRIWIAMELCTAGCVSDLLATFTSLNEQLSATIVKHVCGGLDYMHKLQIVHRDIKPGNLLIDSKGAVKLADFGISSRMNSTRTRMQTMIGTPYFLAPEVISGGTGYKEKVDIWAVGITVINLLQGTPPHFDINPMRALFLICQQDPPTLNEPDKFSDDVNQFLSKCLIKDVQERWTAAQLMAHEWLKGAADRLPPEVIDKAGPPVLGDDDNSDDDSDVEKFSAGTGKPAATAKAAGSGPASAAAAAAAAAAKPEKHESLVDVQKIDDLEPFDDGSDSDSGSSADDQQPDEEMERWLREQKRLEEKLSGEKPDSIPMESWLALQRAAAERAKKLTLERQEERRRGRRRRQQEAAAGGGSSGSRRQSSSGSNLRLSGRGAGGRVSPRTDAADRALSNSPKRRSRSGSHSSPRLREPSPRTPPADDENTCAGCGKPVEGPHLKAVGRKYHMDHFVCSVCSTSLVGKKFTSRGKTITCLDCHAEQKKSPPRSSTSPTNDDGGGSSGADGADGSSAQLKHGRRLSGRMTPMDSPKVLPRVLEKDNQQLLQQPAVRVGAGSGIRGTPEMICGGCQKPIERGRYLRTNDIRWHAACFVCSVCGVNVGEADTGFKEKEGKLYCKKDYALKFCEKCAGCSEPITESSFSKALGKSWHRACFCCTFCKKVIPAGYVSDGDQKPYCDDACFQKAVAAAGGGS